MGVLVAILTVRRSRANQVVVPLGVCLAGCLIVGAVAMAPGDLWVPVLYAVGAATVLVAWRLSRWRDGVARYASFGALLLLVCALNHVLYLADFIVSGPQFNQWPFFANSMGLAFFKGELMFILGTLLTVWGWKWCGGARLSPAILLGGGAVSTGAVAFAYALSMGAMAVGALRPGVQAALGQLLPSLLGVGLVSAYVLPRMKVRDALLRLVFVVAMSAPFTVVSLGTGMKENIILSLLPSALAAWQWLRNPIARVALVLVGVGALAIITSFVSFYRAEVWYTGQSVRTTQVVQNYTARAEQQGGVDTTSTGLPAFLARNDASWYHGWAVSIADQQGWRPGFIFGPLMYVFVPRMLWPGKPEIRQGAEYTTMVFSGAQMSQNSSSTAAGLYQAFYLGAGWPGALLGALGVGALLAWVTRVAFRVGGNLAAGLYMFAMLPFILRLSENWTVGVLAGAVIAGVYVIAIAMVSKIAAIITLRPALATRH